MANSYTTLWSKERCHLLKKYCQEGSILDVMFGGPHVSEPSFRRYGVKEGDYIYPVCVVKGILYVIGRMRVKQLLSLDEYIVQNPNLFTFDTSGKSYSAVLDQYFLFHPEKRFLSLTCTDEVVVGDEGIPLRLDIALPPDMLERLQFRSQQGERKLKHVVDGKLRSIVSLQGIYRLNEQSAQEIENLLLKELDNKYSQW